LLGELRPYRGAVAGVLLLGVVVAAEQPIGVKLTQQLIDGLKLLGGDKPTPDALARLPWLLVGLYAVGGVAKFFHGLWRRMIAERVVVRLREKLFERLVRLPIPTLERSRTGDLLAPLQNDLVTVSQGLETGWALAKEPLTFLGLLGMAFYSDWLLATFAVCLTPVVAKIFSRSGRAVKGYAAENLRQFGDLLGLAQEAAAGARTVKAFGLEARLTERFRGIQRAYLEVFRRSAAIQEANSPVVEMLGACLVAGLVAFGGWRVSSGAITAGDFVAFLFALGLMQMPLKQLNNAFLRLKAAQAALDRIYRWLDEPVEPLEASSTRPVPVAVSVAGPKLALEAVTVRYGNRSALDAVSLEFRAGERVALVGASGSGKSTLVSLLPRFFDPKAGSVRVDGVDVREWPLAALRRRVAFVPQEPFLFHGTVEDNLRVAKPDASDAELMGALRAADCDEFLGRSEAGLRTIVGDRGMCLSGGERQRLAIARALLADADVLVLDEATSSLDAESERRVQEGILRWAEGKTVVQIAHRFSAIRAATRIVVLDGGRVVADGPHGELYGANAVYRGLYEMQRLPGRTDGLPVSP
jgi:subfamily B ATP-binding cassette protein MsbA